MKNVPLKYVLMFLATAFLFACGTSEECEPIGNWATTLTFGAGDCELDALTDTFTVTDNGDGTFDIGSAEPGVTVNGSIRDDNGACILSATVTNPDVFDDGTTSGSLSYNITSDVDGKLSGSGSVTFSGDVTCSQAFTVTGTKS